MLHGLDAMIVEASSTDEALRLSRDRQFALVIHDVTSDRGDDLSPVVAVRSAVRPTPLILIDHQSSATATTPRGYLAGAVDCLSKPIAPAVLRSKVAVFLDMHQRLDEVNQSSLIDTLTGVYNRRGFETLARQQMKEARRQQRNLLIFFIDLDGLKEINDNFGHSVGDLALKDTASLLRRVFREPDIVGRLGGDEFVVITVDSDRLSDQDVADRIAHQVAAHNNEAKRVCRLSLSVGAVRFATDRRATFERMLHQADQHMYEHKRRKRVTGESVPADDHTNPPQTRTAEEPWAQRPAATSAQPLLTPPEIV